MDEEGVFSKPELNCIFRLMRTQQLFFFLFGIIFFESCSTRQTDIDGHWHFVVDKNESSGFYHTLDLSDTTGYLNKLRWGYGYPDLVIYNDREAIRYSGFYGEISFRYVVKNDTLLLTNSITNESYKAYRTDSCQIWPDLAFENPVRPQLPVFQDYEAEWLQQSLFTNNIYIGYGENSDTVQSNPILSDGYEYMRIDDIPEKIAKHKIKVLEPLRQRIVINLYADYKVPISLIKEIVDIVQGNGIQKSYISYRSSGNARSKVYQLRIDTMDLSRYENVGEMAPKLDKGIINSR